MTPTCHYTATVNAANAASPANYALNTFGV